MSADPVGYGNDEATRSLHQHNEVFTNPAGYGNNKAADYSVQHKKVTSYEAKYDDEWGTRLLTDPEDTVNYPVNDERVQNSAVFPELYRVLTGEVIKVNKPVFRIGKERSYVDYFVTNNNAVSRSHADIITRESGYFVIDLNSTNRTYINNVPLPVMEETRIREGDILRLGNETFEFRRGSASEVPVTCPSCGTQVTRSSRFCNFCGRRLQG